MTKINLFPTLFSPLSLGETELANRIVLAPMTRARAGEARVPNELMAEYYAQRAGAGLLITEATTIAAFANGWSQSPGIYTDEMEDGWKQVVERVHAEGGTIYLQLWHCGRASHSDYLEGVLPGAASAIAIEEGQIHTPNGKKDYEVPRELSESEIAEVVAAYGAAAQRAMRAGFDGVEIHGANGYLIDTFLQSRTNKRSDRYGGSVEARYTFLKEVFEAVSAEVDPARIGVRLSPNGAFNSMGSPDYREQFLYVATQLASHNLAYLHVMDGLAFGFHELGEPMTLSEFRAVYPGTLMGNCGYTAEAAEKVLAEGDADLVSFGRPYISNPDLVERFRNGWELAEDAPVEVWYSPLGAEGYTDFTTHGSERSV